MVNFILKDNYSSREIELEYGQPWAGGYSTQEVEGTYLRIDGPSRLNVNVDWENSSSLTEAERDIIQTNTPIAGDPDPARYRSLVADTSGVEATANWTTTLGDSGDSLSANATYERSNSLRLQGLDTVFLTDPDGNTAYRAFNAADPLVVDSVSDTYSAAATINAGLGDWQVTGTLDGTHVDSRSLIGRRYDTRDLVTAAAAGDLAIDAPLTGFADAGVDEALTSTDSYSALLTARGSPIFLPAGDVNVTLRSGFKYNSIDSQDTRNPDIETSLSRRRIDAGVNIGVPLTSRRDDVLAAVGDISLNFDAGLEDLSDFGTLYNWSAGLNWGLTDKLSLSATYLYNEDAPSLTQLGAAEILTPNVNYYDFATNQTVLASVITGGNPDLPAQAQKDWKIGLSWELPFLERSRFQVDYIRNHSENVSAGFPVLTPDIEAAFPGRVTRVNGLLVQVDERPVTFAEQDLERLQFGLNLSGQIGKEPESSGGRGEGGGGEGRGRPAQIAGDAPQGGPQGGGEGRRRWQGGGPDAEANRERFMAMREKLCGSEGENFAQQLVDAEANGTLADMNIPDRMLERLRGEDGKIDPARVTQMRERFCSAGAPGQGGGEDRQQGGGNRGGGGGWGGGGFGRGGDNNTGRWFFNLDYTLDLKSTVLIAEGGPLLDLLGGDALSGGGNARHSVAARGGAFYKGFGTFVNARYTGPSTLAGSGLPGSTDLFFDDFFTLDIRAFVDLGQQANLVEKSPFFKNVRVSFDVDNVFDARQTVTDGNGVVPLRYQPFLIDPTGRSFEIEIRKLF